MKTEGTRSYPDGSVLATEWLFDTARHVLEALGQCRCEVAPAEHLGAPSFVAVWKHRFAGPPRRVMLARQAGAADIARWAASDASGATLLILADGEAEAAAGTALCERARQHGRSAEIERWPTFLSQFVNLAGIQAHYRRLEKEYYETEGVGFEYIDPTVLDDDQQRTTKLSRWTQHLEEQEIGGLVYLVAEYGEGKTSFCLNYAFSCLPHTEMARHIPLLFSLSECDAASLEAFVLDRLRADYGLTLTYGQFQALCKFGVFVPVFDAFDQMRHGEAGSKRVERDHDRLQALRSEQSPLYATCRLDFFNRYVKPLRNGADESDAEASTSHLLFLRGFAAEDIREVLRKRPELSAVLFDPANEELLGGIHHKPLMLHVIAQHAETFVKLLEQRRSAGRVTEYDVFNLLYETWLRRKDFQGFANRDEAILVCRDIAERVQLEAMNLALPFADLASNKDLAELFNTRAKREGILEDLEQLPLLDQPKLRRTERHLIVFRFNAYLEFLTARFVLDELASGRLATRAFVKFAPLTWETRRMVTPNLEMDRHGEMLGEIVEATRYRQSRDVEFQGSNGLTLLLDKLQDADVPGPDREEWRRLLVQTRLQHAVLQRLDARGADLTGLDFSHGDLRDADFSYATLRGTNFTAAQLHGARFQEAGALLTTVFIRRTDREEHWRLAGGTENGMLVLWDSASDFPTRSRPHFGAITALDMRPERQRLYSASLDGALCETNLDDPDTSRRYPMAMGNLRAMVLTADGRTAIVGGDHRVLLVRELERAHVHRLQLPPGRGAVVTSIVIDEEHSALFVGDSDGDLFVFSGWSHPSTGQAWGTNLGGPVRALLALTDGSVLALTSDGRAVLLGGDEEEWDALGDGRIDAVSYAREIDTLFWLDGHRLKRRDRRVGAVAAVGVIGQLPADVPDTARVTLGCSPDGTFIAAGGERLVVWQGGRLGLKIARDEPMRMDCTGMVLLRSRGLDEDTLDFLLSRGALAPDELGDDVPTEVYGGPAE